MTTVADLKIKTEQQVPYPNNGLISSAASKINSPRLMVVSNRLPITMSKNEAGEVQICPSSGGLVTALSPVLRKSAGLWTGWPGSSTDIHSNGLLDEVSKKSGYSFETVSLSEKELDDYYLGFSNQTLWPLFHGFPGSCKFDSGYWQTYQKVNRKFAQTVARISNPDDYIWVQDYQLLLIAQELHSIGIKRRIGFFLHTPFPSPDLLKKLPWHKEIIRSLLNYGLIGFQAQWDQANFLWCIKMMDEDSRFHDRGGLTVIDGDGYHTTTGVFPISIDFSEFETLAMVKNTEEMAEQIRQSVPEGQIILGVDRLDYTKGLTLRLKSYLSLLERFEHLHGKVTMIQIVVPSREKIPEYQILKKEIESLVNEINRRFGNDSWLPIRYKYGSLDKPELIAYYRAADIGLVTPVKDGMNLVAKEYCAANVDNEGILILSEFAGAANQMREYAMIVNPYDIDGVADRIHQAYFMSRDERRVRMEKLRYSVRTQDIYWWSNLFLQSAV